MGLGAGLSGPSAGAGAATAPATFTMQALAAPTVYQGATDQPAGSWSLTMSGSTTQGWTAGDQIVVQVADSTGTNCSGNDTVAFAADPTVTLGYSGFGTAAVPTVGTAVLAYLGPCFSAVPNVLLVPFTDSGDFPSASATVTIDITGVTYTVGSAAATGPVQVGGQYETIVGTTLSDFQPPSTRVPSSASPVAGAPSNAVVATVPAPAVPTVTGVSPPKGPSTGGTTVTVTGTGFGSYDVVGCGGTGVVCPCTVTGATIATCPCPLATGALCPCPLPATTGCPCTGTVGTGGICCAPATPCPLAGTGTTGTGTAGTGTAGSGTVTTPVAVQFVPDVTAVHFGALSVPLSTVDVISPTELQVPSPPGPPGPVDVTVSTGGGTSATSAADQFTYTAPGPAPAVLAVFPPFGPTRGYSLVFVFGRSFDHVTGVTFGGNRALWRGFGQSLLLTLAPPAAAPGTVDIRVTTASGGTSAVTPADQYTYVASVVPAG